MLLTMDPENILENVVSSYETRIQSVETLFETTYQLLQGLQDSVLDTRKEREKIHDQLKENLAKNESLRNKDFENMMSLISSHQDKEEQEVRNLSKSYINEQTNLIHELRERLGNFRDALAKGELQRVREFETVIKEILAKQEKRKQEVISKLREFQKEQQETAKTLRNLLAKGRELRIKDLRLMLTKFKKERQDRIVRQEERQREVKNLLGKFKSKRAKAVQKRPVTYMKT